MKTLDEVIKAFEHCTDQNPDPDYDSCAECPYCDAVKGCCRDNAHMTDALHYLREYRSEKVMWEADRKGYLDWIEQYKEAREKHQQVVIELKRNDPLTWDELKQMEGKPVWVEPVKEWMLITEVDEEDCDIWLLSLDGLDYDLMLHENWQAYRKEKK